jgi:hypothetical protein
MSKGAKRSRDSSTLKKGTEPMAKEANGVDALKISTVSSRKFFVVARGRK